MVIANLGNTVQTQNWAIQSTRGFIRFFHKIFSYWIRSKLNRIYTAGNFKDKPNFWNSFNIFIQGIPTQCKDIIDKDKLEEFKFSNAYMKLNSDPCSANASLSNLVTVSGHVIVHWVELVCLLAAGSYEAKVRDRMNDGECISYSWAGLRAHLVSFECECKLLTLLANLKHCQVM